MEVWWFLVGAACSDEGNEDGDCFWPSVTAPNDDPGQASIKMLIGGNGSERLQEAVILKLSLTLILM